MRVVETDAGGTGTRAAKGALFDALAEVAGALSAGRRVEIVDLLAQGERARSLPRQSRLGAAKLATVFQEP
ncbi:hypothetical protein [Ferrimicrobium acidiphilum]|uniref:Uncharacterized protein n=1 Tax=Ferrimicrobium acidiphilum TaxID=121039 RepID=A0ABV3Y611_9ACTN